MRGSLLNDPNQLTTHKGGDPVEVPLTRVGDWMYTQAGQAFGGYTVQIMRGRMDPTERAGHDKAWGLEFGDPGDVQVFPPPPKAAKQGFLGKLLGRAPAPAPEPHDWTREHLMSKNMGASFDEGLTASPEAAIVPDDAGQTLLHRHALAGNLACIESILRHGGDPAAKDAEGRTPLDLARAHGWTEAVALLEAAG